MSAHSSVRGGSRGGRRALEGSHLQREGGLHMNLRSFLLPCLCAAALAPVRGEGGASADGFAASELRRAAERGQTCSPTTASGVGLRGEYFGSAYWQGVAMGPRTEGPIDFDAASDFAKGSAREHARSARWTGWIKAPISGSYRFHSDDPGLQVLVARTRLAGDGAAADAQIELAAGRFYPVVVMVGRISAAHSRIRLEWTAPHGARYVVPRSLLFPPSDTVAGPR
jgi:PA14 domain